MPQLGGLGGWEWIIILVIVVIIFGTGKLSQVGGALGKSIREFRNASTGVDESDDVSSSDEESVSDSKA